jgi:AcrR family transcriptional regulator
VRASRTRTYNSKKRREAAERTRAGIIEAAHGLFLSRGYAATTLKNIADAANVALPTIYSVFQSKRQLLLAVFDSARLGSDGRHPPATRRDPQFEILSNPSPAHIAAEVRLTRQGGAPVARIISKAAAADPHIAELWQKTQADRHGKMRVLAQTLISRGSIAAGGSIDRITDVLWTLTSNEIYQMLVLDRGWSPQEYEEWLRDLLESAVFGTGR